MSKVWFITGATRGIGKDLAAEALKAGARVVATGRNKEALDKALGSSNNLLTAVVDVSKSDQINDAVQAAIDRFGRIDVLVNNAGYGQLGVFEEIDTQEIHKQFETNVFGLMAVTHAILPIMRKQRSGHVFNISSVAGLKGGFGASIYSASKFAVEGFSQAIAEELRPLGIHVTCVSPGFFRTDFLESNSIKYTEKSIDDYAQPVAEFRKFFANRNHQQAGDPQKLAQVLLKLAELEKPPVSFVAGSDAVQWATGVINTLQEQVNTHKDLSESTDGNWE